MTSNKPVVDFNAIVQADRRRRKNEIAAQRIFDRARRQNASDGGARNHRPNTVPSLASRVGHVGVSKRTFSTSNNPRRGVSNAMPGSAAKSDWTHDLHMLNTPRGPKMVRSNFKDRVFNSEVSTISSPAFNNQFNIVGNARQTGDLSIRGLAGPYTVIVKNLAVGTTPADIESAMTPVGGVVLSCRLVAERPRVIAELILETKEGADNIVQTFNNQSADGNILHVYHKVGVNPSISKLKPAINPVAPLGPRADLVADRSEDSRSYGGSDFGKSRGRSRDRYREYEREDVVDGSYGFNDRMDIDERHDKSSGRGLYSDNLIGNKYGRGSRGDGARGYR